MKPTLLLFCLSLLLILSACSTDPPGPVERAGRAVDNAVYNVGTGVKRTGEKIQDAAQ